MKISISVTPGSYKTVKRKQVTIMYIIESHVDCGEKIAFGYIHKGKKLLPTLWSLNGKHLTNSKCNLKKRIKKNKLSSVRTKK
jgi:hypothetical protein